MVCISKYRIAAEKVGQLVLSRDVEPAQPWTRPQPAMQSVLSRTLCAAAAVSRPPGSCSRCLEGAAPRNSTISEIAQSPSRASSVYDQVVPVPIMPKTDAHSDWRPQSPLWHSPLLVVTTAAYQLYSRLEVLLPDPGNFRASGWRGEVACPLRLSACSFKLRIGPVGTCSCA